MARAGVEADKCHHLVEQPGGTSVPGGASAAGFPEPCGREPILIVRIERGVDV
jgi:hypothetical protein